jgi:hypothetical protein
LGELRDPSPDLEAGLGTMLRIGFLAGYILSSTLPQTLSKLEGLEMTKELLIGVAKQPLSAGGIRLEANDFLWR